MKLKLSLTLLFVVLIFISKVGAIDGVTDNDSSLINAPESSSFAESATQDLADTENTMSWPALPGENLNDIARAFYPKSGVMRRLFVSRTLRLNTQIEPKLKATTVFEEPTLLTIPTLKSLSKSRQAINAANPTKANNEKLSMSYSINKTASNLHAMLLQEYELLVSKNAFLKAELDRLHARIDFLQNKLNDLKLALDKTLNFPSAQAVVNDADNSNTIHDEQNAPKKIFKNLDKNSVKSVNKLAKPAKAKVQNAIDKPVTKRLQEKPHLPKLLQYLLYAVLIIGLLLALGAYALNKYRQRLFTRFNRSVPPMEDTLINYGEDWQDTEQDLEVERITEQQTEMTKSFLNTEMRAEQAKAVSSLEEAKLLMSVNRTQDAIEHLKLTIENQPKTAINHWLYLLEIFRKRNLKEEFEHYAKELHRTFNVMTPVWYETQAAIVVSQHLEDFPHIMEKLDAVWPSELARVFLESLLTDNRDGERAGFSQSVLDEILLLIGLLDARKALESSNT